MPAPVEPRPKLLVVPTGTRPPSTADSRVRADENGPMTVSIECCVAGCRHGRAPDLPPQIGQGPCAEHLSLASPQSRRLLHSAARRLESLQRSWADEKIFEAVVVRGRYLAFCALLESAHDRVDRAWQRVRSEILAAARDPDPGSPSIAPVADLPDPGSGPLDPKAQISPALQE